MEDNTSGTGPNSSGKVSADQQDLQEKFAELQAHAARIKQLREQFEAIDGQQDEMLASKRNVAQLTKLAPGTEMLVPIGQGIYLKMASANPDILVSVGSGVVLEKTIEQANALLDEQVQELAELKQQVATQMQESVDRIEALESHFKGKDE
ncbi:prefoldin subunit alpha [Candidatus Woesearchaeota archaeon CG_4_10_14_0_2_um_filter_57_5]|nr:MAG: prefoldin subunit alpha [Candidatus Woesearchaeota archaeon CG1_02_57_44]PIN68969.1 MAG: prefoldin subunit alpha [Candidatus Woesearchaeota archaeon CG11_big_fil_rev_8_21_14_0_20_57_5]PIZ51852.1 MAG: prefoldin subunit alpha [Candidatus Woesearchaeota archaeon CG_4_10_14_0_2_um_filter_57_5]